MTAHQRPFAAQALDHRRVGQHPGTQCNVPMLPTKSTALVGHQKEMVQLDRPTELRLTSTVGTYLDILR